jgi:hypothetical protein
MPALGGPAAACALLLAFGGATKVRRPGDTVRALRALRLPASSLAVRLGALAEVAIGLAVVLAGGRLPALLMALSYSAFTGFVVIAMVRGGAVSSCGCFGTPDTPPTVTHVLVTMAAAVIGAASVADPVRPVLEGLRHQPLAGVPFVVLTGCAVWFAYMALAVLPKTAAWSGGRVTS